MNTKKRKPLTKLSKFKQAVKGEEEKATIEQIPNIGVVIFKPTSSGFYLGVGKGVIRAVDNIKHIDLTG